MSCKTQFLQLFRRMLQCCLVDEKTLAILAAFSFLSELFLNILEFCGYERKNVSLLSKQLFTLSGKNHHICSHQPCKRCQKNNPATNPMLFSMLNNGWRKPMNLWANGLYSHLSAHILRTHCPFSSSFTAHILSALCVCMYPFLRVYMHAKWQLNTRWLNPSSWWLSFRILIFNKSK